MDVIQSKKKGGGGGGEESSTNSVSKNLCFAYRVCVACDSWMLDPIKRTTIACVTLRRPYVYSVLMESLDGLDICQRRLDESFLDMHP